MDVEVSDEMVEAIAQFFDSDAWHPNLRKDGLGVYWHSRRARAREKAKVAIPLIASQVEAATIERCAKVAENCVEQECCGNFRCDVNEGGEPIGDPQCCGSPTITPMYPHEVAAAIRSLSEGEKG